MTGREIIEALKCGKPSCVCAKGKLLHCVAHNDANPSLSVTESNGKALFKCHAGCTQEALIAALKERGMWGTTENTPTPIRSARGTLTQTYQYVTADGELVAEHGRFESATGKTFAWRVPGKDWRDGLGTVAIHDLPLYGLQRVLEAPDAAVWVVEGEKAATEAYAHGLAAVCLGGGANQQSFGNTLDPLRDRDVILWPDNDEPGAAFMARLAGLLPQARYCRPIVPPKGDAYDYFVAGGTVAGLLELMEDPEATVSITGRDSLSVTIPVMAGTVRFDFSELTISRREVSSVMEITVDIAGKPRLPYSTRINLASGSARNDARREVGELYPGKDLNWTALLQQSAVLCQKAWRGIDRTVDLASIGLPEARRWAIEQFAPLGMTTITFGMGGSQKSLLSADLALHCLYGMPWKGRATEPVNAVLVIDYEDQPEEWRLRIQQLCDGYGWPFPESGYRYMNGDGIPLADQAIQIRKSIEEWGVGLVVVDSAISAAGGDLLDTQAIQRLMNALHDFEVTSILIAHNTKAEDSKYPYGSIFFHNLARATHYVEAVQEDGAKVADVAVYNRKANRGVQKPIAIRVTYSDDDTGPTFIQLQESVAPSLQKPTLKGDIAAFLSEGASDASEIARVTGYSRQNVVEALRSDPRFAFVRKDGRRSLYGLANEHVSPDPYYMTDG